jgi:NADPH2:quinone reductase
MPTAPWVEQRGHVLVAGGGDAVGHAAIQLVKGWGSHLIDTVSTPEKAALAEETDADMVVNYRDHGVTASADKCT